MKLILKNKFHNNPEVVVYAKKLSNSSRYYIIKAPVWKRVMKKMCGVIDCRCGGLVGNKSNLNGLTYIGEDQDGNGLFSIYEN